MTDDLPTFEHKDAYYFLKGETAQKIVKAINTNRVCCATNGGLRIASSSSGKDGVQLDTAPSGGGGNSKKADLPKFENNKFYLLSSKTVKALLDAAKACLITPVDGSGIQITKGDDGQHLSLSKT